MWLKPVIFFVWSGALLAIGWLNRWQRLEEERWVASLTSRTTGEISGGLSRSACSVPRATSSSGS